VMSKVVRMALLLDIYGSLLTEKQRQFIRLHYEDDLSFGEIAAQHKISRQAAYESVKQGENSLLKFEKHLGILKTRNKKK